MVEYRPMVNNIDPVAALQLAPPMIIRFASCIFVENTMPWYGTEKVQLFNDLIGIISLLPLETQVGAVLRGIHSSDLGH